MTMDIPDELFCGDSGEGAAYGLFAIMAGISEECWCAGWMSGNEYALWQVKPGQQYGQGEITERQALLLQLLSEECDGWWYWDGDGPRFIRKARWLELTQDPPPSVET